MVFEIDKASSKLVANIPDGDKRNKYSCTLAVCESPTCRCQTVDLTFAGQKVDVDPDGFPRPARGASIDLRRKEITPEFLKRASSSDLEFAKALVAEMDDSDFHLLRQLQFSVKNSATEAADPSTISPYFDYGEIEGSSKMQVYNDILPFGDRLIIEIDGTEYILLDQFCLRPKCDCSEVYIEAERDYDDDRSGESAHTVKVNYKSKHWETVADSLARLDLGEFRKTAEESIPDFYKCLARRHAKLRAIYKRCRKQNMAALRGQRQSKSAARNDPCPCGSGKKYKKCCMR